jgi:PKD repeat protein
MFSIQKIKLGLVAALASAALLSACEYDMRDLAPAPDASFTVTPVSGQVNKYLLTSTSTNAFMYDWDRADGKGYVRTKSTDTAYFSDKGTYTVKLLAYGQNGIDTASQVITVAADDPAAQTPMKLLTNNSSKTWILDQPNGGALFIGPSDFSQTWWSNTAADVTARACQFNDEYTFSKDGTFKFDNKGDMWIDEEGGKVWPNDVGLTIGCHQASEWPTAYSAWSSGNHQFQVIDNKKLKVIGKGAHLGLYKAGDAGVTAAPEETITYDIVSITADKLVIKKDYGWGAWRFTFKAK